MRQVLTIALLVMLDTSTAFAAAACGNGVLPRREWRSLSATEKDAFIAALQAVMSREGKPISAYDELVKLHADYAGQTHNAPVFLPWHRWYLSQLEQELQKVSPKVTLPYWDFSLDSQAPERAAVWGERAFGGNGAGPDKCVESGAFKAFIAAVPKTHCLARDWSAASGEPTRMAPFSSSEAINQQIAAATSYDQLRRSLELVPHAAVHNAIGGDMASDFAPNDPIYWLVHANVDRWWATFQQNKPTLARTYGGVTRRGVTAASSDPIPGASSGTRVSEVLDTKDLCYQYQQLAREDSPLPPPK